MDRDKFEKLLALNPVAPKPPVPEVPNAPLQVGFDVVEVQKVGLQANDVLMVTVKNDDLSQESVDALRKQLQLVFPNNRVFVFAMGTSDDIHLSVVSQEAQNSVANNCQTSYCSDCDCGKKEQI